MRERIIYAIKNTDTGALVYVGATMDYDTIKLRLPLGYGARLDALCESEGQSASKLVATWIDGAERELRELRR